MNLAISSVISDPRHAFHSLSGLMGCGQKMKIQLFQNNVMWHQIKGNHELSSMVANILLPDPYQLPTPTP